MSRLPAATGFETGRHYEGQRPPLRKTACLSKAEYIFEPIHNPEKKSKLGDTVKAGGLLDRESDFAPKARRATLRGGIKMNRSILSTVLASFFILVLLSACSDQKEPAKSEAKVTSQEVKQEAKEAVETAKAYTYQQKDDYLNLMKAKMEDLDRQIQELQAKAESKASEVKTQSKTEFNQAMEELRSKKQAAEAKYESLKSASAEAWNDMRSGMDSAMDEMSAAFERARASFDK